MCGRISLTTPASVIARLFGVTIPFDLPPRYNVAPTQRTLVIRREGEGLTASMLRWGFIPSWRKSGEKGPEPINARSETAASNRLFAEALRRRRCIVPASGFYEWQATTDGKQPHHIESVGAEAFALAGLWSRWVPADAEPVETFTVLTCAPNAVMRPIHDRMPVILPAESIAAWLDPGNGDAADMLRPIDDAAISASAVSTRVNNPRNDDEECLRRI